MTRDDTIDNPVYRLAVNTPAKKSESRSKPGSVVISAEIKNDKITGLKQIGRVALKEESEVKNLFAIFAPKVILYPEAVDVIEVNLEVGLHNFNSPKWKFNR